MLLHAFTACIYMLLLYIYYICMFPEAIHSTAIENYNKTQNYGCSVNCSFDLFECGIFYIAKLFMVRCVLTLQMAGQALYIL